MPRLPFVLPALPILALLAFPAASPAALPPQAKYDVRVEATMTDKWDFKEYSETECDDGTCVRDETGSGTARIHLQTKVWRLVVTGGQGKRPPYVDVGNAGGLPFKGEYNREGVHVTDYRGSWEAANPDQTEPAGECGRKPIKSDVGFAFPQRNRVYLTALIDDLRECPMGPPRNLEWENGEVPSLGDVVVNVAQSKFGRAKQFRLRGSKTFKGTVDPFSRTEPGNTFVRGGSQEVTWTWEATFRKVGKKKKRRR